MSTKYRRTVIALALSVSAGCSTAMPTGAPSVSGGSWMAKVDKSSPLFYVSDGGASGTNDVYVYTMPRGVEVGKRVGTLTGFTDPFGLCTDAAGDVWVTDYGASDLVEYAHGGTTPIKTLLTGSGQSVFGCAVNPKNGDLAVATRASSHRGGTGILIYKGASGQPTLHRDNNFQGMWYDGYDSSGHLFVIGTPINPKPHCELAEFDGKRFTTLTGLTKKITRCGAVQAISGTINVEDDSSAYTGVAMMYEEKLNGKKLSKIATSYFIEAQNCQQMTLLASMKSGKLSGYAYCPEDNPPLIQRYAYPNSAHQPALGSKTGPFRAPTGTAISE